MVWADLHTHTGYSDGRLTPEALVEKAQRCGLKALAVTDHDTVAGVDEAQAAGERLGVGVASGVELSVTVENKELHLLGYGFDPADADLRAHLETFLEARRTRARNILERLHDLDVQLRTEAVAEQVDGSCAVGRPHVARALVAEGHVASTREAFDRYLKDGGPAFVAKPRVPAGEALALLHAAGGIGVLAHPGADVTETVLRRLVNGGLDGIEVFHPVHDPALVHYYRRQARLFALFETGGSDYHGQQPVEENRFGACGLSQKAFEKLPL